MFSYEVYKLVHFFGIFLVFAGLGGACLRGITGVEEGRRLVAISHGVGLLAVLVGGFGMLARLGMHSFPGWIVGKLGIWIVLGGVIVLAKKRPETAKAVFFAVPVLGLGAAWLAVLKPF